MINDHKLHKLYKLHKLNFTTIVTGNQSDKKP